MPAKGMRVPTALTILSKARPDLLWSVSITQWCDKSPIYTRPQRYTITALMPNANQGACLIINDIRPLALCVEEALDIIRTGTVEWN